MQRTPWHHQLALLRMERGCTTLFLCVWTGRCVMTSGPNGYSEHMRGDYQMQLSLMNRAEARKTELITVPRTFSARKSDGCRGNGHGKNQSRHTRTFGRKFWYACRGRARVPRGPKRAPKRPQDAGWPGMYNFKTNWRVHSGRSQTSTAA